MGVDVSARARTVGITTQFKNLRGGAIQNLPQRIMLVAHGQTGVTYSSTKKQIFSASEAGATYGYQSQIALAALELFPLNGDGVDTIPVTVYPLSDAGGGSAAAAGDVTPSGTATEAASYQLVMSGIKSLPFVIPRDYAMATAAQLSDVLGRIGDAVNAITYRPVVVDYSYGTVTATPGAGNTGNGTCTTLSVTGTPRPGAWLLTLNTAVAEGGVWTFTDPNGTIISKTLTQTTGVGEATVFDVGGIQFTITDGTTDFAVGDTFTIDVPATDITLTAGWHGVSGNDIVLSVDGPSVGITFAITQPTGGLVNPTVDAALDQVGEVWETIAINGLNIEDTTALDAYQTFGDGRWGTLVHKPLVFLTGNNTVDVNDATFIPSGRTADRVNGQVAVPGSPNLPCVIAARHVARIAKKANNNPPSGYGALKLQSLTAGTDAQQWNYTQRDAALKAGSSTTQVKNGVLEIGQVITFWAPVGEPDPAYRFVRDIVKLQNIIYNVNIPFEADDWASAPFLPDDQATTNPAVRKARTAIAIVSGIIDSLAEAAIIADPETAKSTITAVQNGSNPNRIDIEFTVALSPNTDIKDVTLNFGFFFGQAA